MPATKSSMGDFGRNALYNQREKALVFSCIHAIGEAFSHHPVTAKHHVTVSLSGLLLTFNNVPYLEQQCFWANWFQKKIGHVEGERAVEIFEVSRAGEDHNGYG